MGPETRIGKGGAGPAAGPAVEARGREEDIMDERA